MEPVASSSMRTSMPKRSRRFISADFTGAAPTSTSTYCFSDDAWSSFMWAMTGAAKARQGSTDASMYSSTVTPPARAKPPTNDTSRISSMRYILKSPKFAQNAPGCDAR